MFAIDIFESADPVFAHIQQQRHTLLSRPYAGYLLFFFGEADTEIATWFARNIIALDSLTGSSLAGLVFAHKIRIHAQRVIETPPASRRGHTSSRLTDPHHVVASSVREVDHVRLPFDYQSLPDFQVRKMVSNHIQAVFPEEEITAINYGSDDLAERFGVLADMPCIVLLNAVPSGTVETIKLSDCDSGSIIALLRQLVAEFSRDEQYSDFFTIMRSLHLIEAEIRAGLQSRDLVKAELGNVRNVILPEFWQLYAKDAFLKGDIKLTRKVIWENGHLRSEELRTILSELKNFKGKSHREEDPLQLERLQAKANDLFPNAESDRLRLLAARDELRSQIQARVASVAESIANLERRHDKLIAELKGVQVPNLQEVFRRVDRVNNIGSTTRAIKATLYGWVGSFLQPETLLKIGTILQ